MEFYYGYGDIFQDVTSKVFSSFLSRKDNTYLLTIPADDYARSLKLGDYFPGKTKTLKMVKSGKYNEFIVGKTIISVKIPEFFFVVSVKQRQKLIRTSSKLEQDLLELLEPTDDLHGTMTFPWLAGIKFGKKNKVWLGENPPKNPLSYRLIFLSKSELKTKAFTRLPDRLVWKKRETVLLSTNVKDEVNMDEWIKWHLSLGFTHILIFDDMSKIPIKSSYDNVTVIVKHANKKEYMQKSFDFAKNRNIEYVLHLDADEYLYLKQPNIQDFIRLFPPSASAICIHWLFFGSSGIEKADTSKLIPLFKRSSKLLSPYVKTLAKVNQITSANCPHTYLLKSHDIYDTTLKSLPFLSDMVKENLNPSYHTAYIAHYHIQTREEFMRRHASRVRDDTREAREAYHIKAILENFTTIDNDVENLDLVNRLS